MIALRKFWRAETGLWLGIWFSLLIIGRSQLFRDPGTFWHTAMGQRLLDAGQFLATDPFSFTFGGRPWVPHEWLAECAMALVHRFSGFDGLLLVTATLLASVYTWVGHRLIQTGLHWLPTTMLVILTIAVSSSNFHVRPHIVSIAFLGLTFALIAAFEAGRIPLGRLAWLVPLFVGWANWHGAMLGGFGTLGLAVLGWTGAWVVARGGPIEQPRQAVWLWGLVVACAGAALVNPYGFGLPRTWMEIMRSPVLPRLIVEHTPPDPRTTVFWAILGLGLLHGGALVTTLPRWPRVTWLIPLVWFGLALSRIRHAPLFGIVTLLALADILPHSRLARWLARPGRDLFLFLGVDQPPTPRRSWQPCLVPGCLILAAVALQATGTPAPLLGRGWAQLDRTVWPVELLPELRHAEQTHPAGARILNDYQFGGFLIYHTPALRVFIDDRCEVYGDAWLERFDEASTMKPGLIDEWLRTYQIDYVLVGTGSGFDRHVGQQPGWSVLGRCPVATLHGRMPQAAGEPLNRQPLVADRPLSR